MTMEIEITAEKAVDAVTLLLQCDGLSPAHRRIVGAALARLVDVLGEVKLSARGTARGTIAERLADGDVDAALAAAKRWAGA